MADLLLDAPEPCDCCIALLADHGRACCDVASTEERRAITCANALRRYRDARGCAKFRPVPLEFVDLALQGCDVTPPFKLPAQIGVHLGPDKMMWLIHGGTVLVDLEIDGQKTTLVLDNAAGRNPRMPPVRN